MRRLKKATPEFEEVDEGEAGEEGWVSYKDDRPNMDLLRPLLRTAEAMLDPTTPNSYHIKMSAAQKMVKALGKDFTIENDAIVKALPFILDMTARLNAADRASEPKFNEDLRSELEALPKAAYDGIKGICIFNEGKIPAQLKKDWLYVSVPLNGQVNQGLYAHFSDRAGAHQWHSERSASAVAHPARFSRNGFSSGGDVDLGLLGPQTIYIKFYMTQAYMATVIVTAIRVAAQRAMGMTAGNTSLKDWLPEVGTAYAEERKKRLTAAEEEAKKYEAEISQASDLILTRSLQLEAAKEQVEMYSRKLAAKDIIKELPALEMIDYVNRDDPFKTVIRTKDIVLHGVNLGPYMITMMQNSMNVAIMGTKVAPDGIVHPNIWQKDGKWHQDFDKDQMKELIKAIGANNMHLAANLIINNLMNCPNSGDHAKRLEALRVAIEEKEAKAKAAAEKRKTKQEPKTEEVKA